LFFRNTIVFLSNKIDEKILRHEEGHVKQFNYIYAFLVSIAAVQPLIKIIVIPGILLGKFILWNMERDADLYAYFKYGIKYESGAKRPNSRIERLKEWIFDSHPPDWVRTKGEYYEKKVGLVKLLLNDLLS
jgi:hypothetical protein